MVLNFDTIPADHKKFCDDHVPLSRTISMSKLFQAEALYSDRVRSGERNVRVLVSRDVNVMQWLQTDAGNPLSNICLEVEFLNSNALTDTTIGDIFINKVQRTAHHNVLGVLETAFNEWRPDHQWSLQCSKELVAPGWVLRPDIAVFHQSTPQQSTLCLIIDIEIKNHTPLDVHDRFVRYFSLFPSLNAAIEINFCDLRADADRHPDEADGSGYSALAVLYRRRPSGQIVVDEGVDFGAVPLDSETLADLSTILLQHRLRLLEPRPDASFNPGKCPWDSDERPFVTVNMEKLISEGKSHQKAVQLFIVDLWKLFSALCN